MATTYPIAKITGGLASPPRVISERAASLEFKLQRAGTRWKCVMENGQDVLFDQEGGRNMAYRRAAGIAFGLSGHELDRLTAV